MTSNRRRSRILLVALDRALEDLVDLKDFMTNSDRVVSKARVHLEIYLMNLKNSLVALEVAKAAPEGHAVPNKLQGAKI